MKLLVTFFALTTLGPFCVCRKSLEAHFDDTNQTVFDQQKFSPFSTKPVDVRRKSLTEEAADEDRFSAAVIKKNLDDEGGKGRDIYPADTMVTVPEITKVRTTTAPEKIKIPESLLIAMNNVQTADEFLRRFVSSEPDYDHMNITDDGFIASNPDIPSSVRKGLSGGLSSLATAEFAACRPQKSVVKVIENSESDGVFLWPPCVYLKRCGGCCTTELMTCRPTNISFVNVTVLQARYTGPQSNPFASEGMRVIAMEQHNSCTCGCKVLPQDCSPLQEYRRHECRCVCANQNGAARCQQRPNKFWNSHECACKCRDPVDCSSGLYFNTRTCRCEVLRYSRRGLIGKILAAGNETAYREQPQLI